MHQEHYGALIKNTFLKYIKLPVIQNSANQNSHLTGRRKKSLFLHLLGEAEGSRARKSTRTSWKCYIILGMIVWYLKGAVLSWKQIFDQSFVKVLCYPVNESHLVITSRIAMYCWRFKVQYGIVWGLELDGPIFDSNAQATGNFMYPESLNLHGCRITGVYCFCSLAY